MDNRRGREARSEGIAPPSADFATRHESHFGDRVVCCFPERPRNYFAMVEAAASRNPDGEAIVFGDQRMSWSEVAARSRAFAYGLASLDIKAGDRLALLLGNRPEFIIAYFACSLSGVILVAINPRENAAGVEHVLRHSGARAIVYEAASEEKLGAELKQELIRISPDAGADAALMSELCRNAPEIIFPEVVEEQVISLAYTSGTTGTPKGVRFTHLGVIHAAMYYAHCVGLTEKDRSIVSMPLAFTGGMVSALAPIVYCGGTILLMEEFKAHKFLEFAAAEKMTYALMVPTMYALCLRQPEIDDYDLSSWRNGTFGAAPMPVATLEQVLRKYPHLRLMNSYGATEAGGPAVFMKAEYTADRLDSVGQAFPGVKLAVMDEAGRELPAGTVGELWIQGPAVSPGFWRDPERTTDEYHGGWWRSGDIATLDEDGFLRLVDRRADMINRGGYKISSIQVENALYTHPDVLECVVVGKKDELLGERVHAVVYLNNKEILAQDIIEYSQSKLPKYKSPETVQISYAPLPRSANGKILKRLFRES